jgi:hypothetical protein
VSPAARDGQPFFKPHPDLIEGSRPANQVMLGCCITNCPELAVGPCRRKRCQEVLDSLAPEREPSAQP